MNVGNGEQLNEREVYDHGSNVVVVNVDIVVVAERNTVLSKIDRW